MRPDHYATLEVDPGASAAEIRAAYLKLLREYHPDRNRSPEAIDRTKAIITAFKVLGDFDQRSYYDWDRRRDREKAEAAAARTPRRRVGAGIAAGGLGLAAVGAWLLFPGANSPRTEPAPILAAAGPEQEQAARPTSVNAERYAAEMQPRKTLASNDIAAEAKLASRSASRELTNKEPAKVAPKEVERMAARKTEEPRSARATAERPPNTVNPQPPVRVASKPAAVVRVAAKPVTDPPKPAQAKARQPTPRTTTDLASLDQFVMNFYGQSWRYGDAPKRSKLEQTKAGFVVRRGACVAETCKRAAYLKLMRDVSEIIQSDQPKPR